MQHGPDKHARNGFDAGTARGADEHDRRAGDQQQRHESSGASTDPQELRAPEALALE